MFDADRPITSSAQDKLNRTLFAKYLARCMLDHKDPNSLVVGLYGGWGSGKTSVINLVLEELRTASSSLIEAEQPIILNFSPWSYSGQDQLIYSFFRRLSSVLHDAHYLEHDNDIIYLLELYASYFTHKPIPKPYQPERTLLERLTGKKGEDEFGWNSGHDLTEVKAELNSLLNQQNRKIIIIIDNISRLYDHEVRQIFQIVKSMADYTNTAYLLAFDKEEVIKKLNRLDKGSGEHFIEKVVQLPFDVPPIMQQDLESIFAEKMNDIILQVPEGAWSMEYWAEIYYSDVRYFFDNCRDITRYVNTLNFSYLRLRDIVNPVDFFALTAIEVFAPEVYFGVRDNKDLFTDLLDNVYLMDQDQIHADKLRCDEILSRTQRIPRDVLLDLLTHLFPRIKRIYHPNVDMYHSGPIARKLKRICSPDLFEAYFRLSMQAGHIQSSEFDTLLALASDKPAFEQALTRLNQDERILKFLDQLDSKVIQTIPPAHFPALIGGLLENGDLFPHGISGLLSLDTPMRIHRIIHALLKRVEHAEKRFELLRDAINEASKSIYILVHEMTEQGREHLEESDTFVPEEYRDISVEQLRLLRESTVDKINYWAHHGNLAEHPRMLPILYAWIDWGHEQECRAFVKKLTDTDKGLVAFLTQTLNKAIAQAMIQYRKDPSWHAYLNDINLFIPAETLEAHAKELFEDDYFEKLRENEQLAVMIFLDLIHSHANKVIPKTTS